MTAVELATAYQRHSRGAESASAYLQAKWAGKAIDAADHAPHQRLIGLDLNNSGAVEAEFSGYTDAADQQRKAVSWIDRDDAVIYIERDGMTGPIVSAGDLLVDNRLPDELQGLAALKWWDGSGDNKIDSTDKVFASLRVWHDANGNGRVDAGESKTFAEMGITAVQFGTQTVVTFANGSTRVLGEVDTGVTSVFTTASMELVPSAEHAQLEGTAEGDLIGNKYGNDLIGNDAVNLLDGKLGDDRLYGHGGNDILIGGAGNDVLDGGSGVDTMAGGTGDDAYLIDSADDVVREAAGEGNDTVWSTIDTTLGTNIENGVLMDSFAFDLTGNAANNQLVGNAFSNVIDGKAGADAMAGGKGNDTYYVDNAGDVVVESANEGADTVHSSVTFALGENIENLRLTGSAALDGTGNALANILSGNSGVNLLEGFAGNDTLDGGAAADRLQGGAGDDTYVVDNVADDVREVTRTWIVSSVPDHRWVTVQTGVDESNNPVYGQEWRAYQRDTSHFTLLAASGNDTVKASISYQLGADIENLTLTGSANIDGTGNAVNNILTGNSGNNRLDGAAGADALRGGAGNDTYVVDAQDAVEESAGNGIDTVEAGFTYTLGANLDNLTLTGAAAINGAGNALDNVLTGNAGVNVLTGGAGNDTYVIGAGDVVVEAANGGTDTIVVAGSYSLAGQPAIENLTITGTGGSATGNGAGNVLRSVDGGNNLTGGLGDDTYYIGTGDTITEAAGEGADTVAASITWSLAANANLENLTLTGTANIDGTGNAGDNIIAGNAGANVLNGGAGADVLRGGLGDDTYVLDAADTVVENAGEGVDTVLAGFSHVLGANLENLVLTGSAGINGTGNALDNVLTGNAGVNVLTGGAGNDTYFIGIEDAVTEAANGGVDTVVISHTYSLTANLENLTLSGSAAIDGTGNAGANVLRGNAGANVLAGLGGDDIYFVGAGDIVQEGVDGGVDTVNAEVTWTLGANQENLTLMGTGATAGTGNALANIITGNAAANALAGLAGDDIYFAGAGDTVTEAANEGTDTVVSSVSFTLGTNLENLTLSGSANINATGNALNNVLRGNVGNNVLAGGAGSDTYHVDNAGDVVVEAVSLTTYVSQNQPIFLGYDESGNPLYQDNWVQVPVISQVDAGGTDTIIASVGYTPNSAMQFKWSLSAA